jgi:hypothetical protein
MKTFPIKIGNAPSVFKTWLLKITMFSGRIIYKWIIFNSKLSKNQRVLSPIKLVMIHWFMVYEMVYLSFPQLRWDILPITNMEVS